MQDDYETYHEPTAEELAALATFMPSFTVTQEPSPTTTIEDKTKNDGEEDGNGDEYEFNLFGTAQTTKISIEESKEVEYTCPVRPIEYYKHIPTPLHLDRIHGVVLSGAQIIAASSEKWASDNHRVTHVPYLDKEQKKTTRWRPSKARRRKFDELREKERKSREIRMLARSRGRGRGTGRGGHISHRGQSRPSESIKNKASGTGGYPRKGPAPV